MNVYYVDATSGDDAKDGKSQANAWKSMAKVNGASFSPDDQVLFKRGETWPDQLLVPSSGTAGHPILFGDYGAGALPVIAVSGVNASIRAITKNYVTYQNIKVTGATTSGLYFTSCTGVVLSGVVCDANSHGAYFAGTCGITATNCTFSANANNGVLSENGTFIFTACTFRTSASGQGLYGNHASSVITCTDCIFTGNHSSGANCIVGTGTFTRCISYSNSYDGFLINAGSTASFTDCVAYSNAEDGFSCNSTGAAVTMTCMRCQSYNNGIGAVSTAGDGFTAHLNCSMHLRYCSAWGNTKSGAAMVQTSGGTIYHCTFYNNYEPTIANDYGIYLDATGGWIIKNCVTKHHRYEIYVTAAAVAAGNITFDYNCYHDSRGGAAFYWNDMNYTFAAYAAASGQDAHSLNADPLFANPAGADLHLTRYSPCIDKGIVIAGVTSAYFGSAPDLGCFELTPRQRLVPILA